jgi:hypothetical protein
MLPSHHNVRALLPKIAEASVFVQAKRSLGSRAPKISPAILAAEHKIAKDLLDTNIWTWTPRNGKPPKMDRSRVNIVSDKLCDDALNYIKPTLERHKGCDIIDVFPGTGLWSQKLNDMLQPRSHLLLEPDMDFYQPWLQPLLERPGTQLLPKNGIVWDELAEVLTPECLPHQVERRYKPSETPERNDTLLVTVNLSFFPKKKFRSFGSVSQLVLFQLLSTIRPGALFQKYGLVRMLIWVVDDEKQSILPRMVQRRTRVAVEADIATEWTCEIAGAEASQWYLRDVNIDAESMGRTLQRMRESGLVMPPGRESQAMKDFALSGGEQVIAGQQGSRLLRSYQVQRSELVAKIAKGELDEKANAKRLKSLETLVRAFDKRDAQVDEMMALRARAIEIYSKAGSDEAQLAEAARLIEEMEAAVMAFEKLLRTEFVKVRDNLHAIRQDPPLLAWDRRYVEPLAVQPAEFFPNVPCALLDIQPRAVPSALREMGPNSTRSGDMFELILRGLLHQPTSPISKALEYTYPGAYEALLPNCPSLRDPKLGGSPFDGYGGISTRVLNARQLAEIVEAWAQWPFKPSYGELVARAVDDGDVTVLEDKDPFQAG